MAVAAVAGIAIAVLRGDCANIAAGMDAEVSTAIVKIARDRKLRRARGLFIWISLFLVDMLGRSLRERGKDIHRLVKVVRERSDDSI